MSSHEVLVVGAGPTGLLMALSLARRAVAVRSPYPQIICYPQDDHERMLGGKAARDGIEVEWRTELTEVELKATVLPVH